MTGQNEQTDLYRIGTVASLTGISVERLRAWERRYDLSPAHKSGKTRFYSKTQLDRLKLIKHLIDQGQPISSLADLSMEQLLARTESTTPESRSLDVLHQPTAAIIGPNLMMLEQQTRIGGDLRLDITARWANMEAFEADQSVLEAPQIMLVQLPVLSVQPIDFIKKIFPNTQIVVVYQFATAKTITDLENEGLQSLKWPLTWSELEHVAIAEVGSGQAPSGLAPRRYSDEELIALASGTEDESNCVQYLVEAISQLNAFSGYAQDASLAMPRGQLYRTLQAESSAARAQLEATLDSYVEQLQRS